MINLNVPDFVLGERCYTVLTHLQHDHPEIFYDDTKIVSVFGCFHGAIWNGGSIFLGGSETRQVIQDTIDHYNYNLKLPVRFTFTNSLITKDQCLDTYCNMIAECGHNGYNEILVVSPTLENYLRDKYPNYKYMRSIIAAENEPYKDDKKYDLTVMKRIKNNDWDYLDQIPQEVRHKIEFLCTDPCPDNCPRLYTHYRDYARAQIRGQADESCACTMENVKGPFVNAYAKTQKTYIDRETILKEYLPRNFNQFKLSGRGNVTALILHAVEYMIKPEYHHDVLSIIFHKYLPRDHYFYKHELRFD